MNDRVLHNPVRCPWECEGFSCGKEYATKFGKGALKHLHSHLADPRCSGDLKRRCLTMQRITGLWNYWKRRDTFEVKSLLHEIIQHEHGATSSDLRNCLYFSFFQEACYFLFFFMILIVNFIDWRTLETKNPPLQPWCWGTLQKYMPTLTI